MNNDNTNQLFRQKYQAQRGIASEAAERMSQDMKRDLMGRDKEW